MKTGDNLNTTINFPHTQDNRKNKPTLPTLGNNTNNASPSESDDSQSDFIYRLNLQSYGLSLVPDNRMRVCLRYKRKDSDNVQIVLNDDNKASFKGLMVCSNLWACPICSKRIMTERGFMLERAFNNASVHGCESYLMTLTLKHTRYDRLETLLDTLSKAYRYMFSGKVGQALKHELGYVGSIRAIEIRVSFTNGFHPHYHIGFITDKPIEIEQIKAKLAIRWKQALNHFKGDCDLEIGLDFRHSKKGLFDYLTKASSLNHELTNSEKKKSSYSYTPLELLDLAYNGDNEAKSLWIEYTHAIKGTRFLVFSKGLKETLNITDESESESPVTDNELKPYAVFNTAIWKIIKSHSKDLRSKLLVIAKNYDITHMIDYLTSNKILWLDEAMTIHPNHPINRDIARGSVEYYEALRYFDRESIIRF